MMKVVVLFALLGCALQCQLPPLPPTRPPTTAIPATPPTTAIPTSPTSTVGLRASNFSCECGIANRFRKIVGGVETEAHEYPWQVGLAYEGSKRPFCGGSLISNQHVLTAAHCIGGSRQMVVLLGDHSLYLSEEKRVKVCKVKNHPEYNDDTFENDFSVLTLCEPTEFTKKIRPVCLPHTAGQGTEYEGKSAIISGWGTVKSSGPRSNILLEASVNTMSNKDCCAGEKGYECKEITEQMMCASNPGVDSCQGDSGGPMVTEGRSGRYVLIGVVSWGIGCAQKDHPGVYARVTTQLNWITEGVKACNV